MSDPLLIEHAYDCTIKQYIDFAFMNRRNVLTISGEPTEAEINEAFSQIQEEFSDSMSGENDFRIESHHLLQIYRLQQKINVFDTCIGMQRNFLQQWGEAFEEGIAFINENYHAGGVKLTWTGDANTYEELLVRFENFFKSIRLHLVIAKSDYEEELKERKKEKDSRPASKQQQSFASFINLLTSMKTYGISFDKEKDYLIELGFAVRMVMDNNKKAAATVE